jgi:hypothetical protein
MANSNGSDPTQSNDSSIKEIAKIAGLSVGRKTSSSQNKASPSRFITSYSRIAGQPLHSFISIRRTMDAAKS